MSNPSVLCVSYRCRLTDPLETTFLGGRQGPSSGARLRLSDPGLAELASCCKKKHGESLKTVCLGGRITSGKWPTWEAVKTRRLHAWGSVTYIKQHSGKPEWCGDPESSALP